MKAHTLHEHTHMAEYLRQAEKLSNENSETDEDGIELTDGATVLSWRDFTQIHRQGAERHS